MLVYKFSEKLHFNKRGKHLNYNFIQIVSIFELCVSRTQREYKTEVT